MTASSLTAGFQLPPRLVVGCSDATAAVARTSQSANTPNNIQHPASQHVATPSFSNGTASAANSSSTRSPGTASSNNSAASKKGEILLAPCVLQRRGVARPPPRARPRPPRRCSPGAVAVRCCASSTRIGHIMSVVLLVLNRNTSALWLRVVIIAQCGIQVSDLCQRGPFHVTPTVMCLGGIGNAGDPPKH